MFCDDMAEATSTSSSRDQARIKLGSDWDQVCDEGRDQFNLAICVSVQIALIMHKTEMAIAAREWVQARGQHKQEEQRQKVQ